MSPITNTGSYIALAGLVVTLASLFGWVLDRDQVVAVIAGGVALYGLVHQIVQVKSKNAQGIRTGAIVRR